MLQTKTINYLQTLGAAERIEACELWYAWASWDTSTEWTTENEREYQTVLYLQVLAELELGSCDYTARDLENYRIATLEG